MRRTGLLLFVIISLMSFNELKAQDPQFSQFYAAPLYINPAFTGASGYTRLGVNYRNQWPNLQSSFKTFSFYMDHYLYGANSGIGLIVTTDQEGSIGLKSTSIGGSYAYQLKINDNLVFRPGVQFSYFTRSSGYGLIFANQIDPITGQVDLNVTDPSVLDKDLRASFGDISVGGVLYSRTLFLGAAVQHLTEPNQSLIDGVSPLQQRLTIHGGIKLKIGEGPLRRDLTYTRAERSITPVFQYKTQGKFSQLDVGAFVHLEPINLGVQYRGVPFKQFEEFPNNEAIIFSVGVTTNNFNIGYSFDYTISELGIEAGGAHEFSLSYFLDFNKPVKVPRDRWRIPCPKN
ncbi:MULTISPECIES: type IX secretion system membrane protein PorP/SprF [Roseivirga]|nr:MULTISPECIES: type IX secretion system membrane protein PorP/SprF [Roseivirga]PWL27576.1 MAG: type IX secretion system membrane protein PorP/SprF [Roseivirga sp. XM-24bin3]MBO6496120.1 type IX secretion system membrane protein PorP/SprF [Roseivirga sp.]MBO6662052.1 type IX secretion system membrane protein PorP/SprF [Roseivirga sp.]MBO6761219.1 type IX secretion system membrane protein PorP/SprF [Roseivirga sp.]MBO6909359.1 type IX secretion system membrane protein PorP/SprF [Roseivirga sp.